MCGQNLRDQMIPPVFLKHKMQMRWSPAMASQLFEQLSHGSVVGNGVADGFNTLEPEEALFVAEHDATLAGSLLVASRVLYVVVATAVRLPNVDLDVADRLARDVFHGADAE